MNPRQRRGMFLLVLAGLGAIGVFVGVSNYVSGVQRQVGPTVTGLRLGDEVQANEPITPEVVRPAQMPERWAPRTMLTSTDTLAGRVAGTTLPRGTLLQDGMLISPADIQPGERELAILVDAETGVAGKIGPGVAVDIYATFAESQTGPAQSRILVQDAEIVDVGVVRAKPSDDGEFVENEVLPVTFAVTVKESLAIAYAESFAQEVRLGLRAPGDTQRLSQAQRTFRAPRARDDRQRPDPSATELDTIPTEAQEAAQ